MTETVVDPDLAKSTGVSNPLVLIQAAIDRGINPDQLGKLLDLQERWERNRAAEAFAEAVTAFQAECPPIFKGRRAGGENKRLQFAFASFDDVMREAGPIMAKYKIAPTFTTDPADKSMKITCRIRVGIHSEETTVTIPIPEGTVNNTQLFGQAVSYGKRYAMCAALNIVCTDEDQDAEGLCEFITEEERSELEDMFMAKFKGYSDADFTDRRKRFLVYVGAETFQQILRSKLGIAREALKIKKNGGTR